MWTLVLRGACVAIVLGGAVVTMARAQDWTNERWLWLAAVESAPQKPRPRINLANLLARSNPHMAADYYRHAIVLAERPGRTQAERTIGVAIARTNLALLQADAGDLAGAQAEIHTIAEQYRVTAVLEVQSWIDRRVSASQP